MKRLFAAIKVHPTEEFASFYYKLRGRLRHEKIRWVALENLHITMKFFGETEESVIPGINEALRMAGENNSVFGFYLRDTGIFGSSYKPKVIWVKTSKDEKLINLASSVFEELEAKGWERDKRNFVSHLTIARMNELRDRQLFQSIIGDFVEIELQSVIVEEFHLFESILTREGPHYKIIETFKLRNPAH